MGWLDVKRRYRRTTLGPFWNSATLAIYTVAVGIVGAGLFHQDIYHYLPYLISGMIVWTLLSTIILESCTLFVTGHALFRNVRFEYSILAYALVWRNFIFFIHNFDCVFGDSAPAAAAAHWLHRAAGVSRAAHCPPQRRLDRAARWNVLPALSRRAASGADRDSDLDADHADLLVGRQSHRRAPVRLRTAQPGLPPHRHGARAAPRHRADGGELCRGARDHGRRMVSRLPDVPLFPQAHLLLELKPSWRG